MNRELKNNPGEDIPMPIKETSSPDKDIPMPKRDFEMPKPVPKG